MRNVTMQTTGRPGTTTDNNADEGSKAGNTITVDTPVGYQRETATPPLSLTQLTAALAGTGLAAVGVTALLRLGLPGAAAIGTSVDVAWMTQGPTLAAAELILGLMLLVVAGTEDTLDGYPLRRTAVGGAGAALSLFAVGLSLLPTAVAAALSVTTMTVVTFAVIGLLLIGAAAAAAKFTDDLTALAAPSDNETPRGTANW